MTTSNYNEIKTLGPQGSYLVLSLYERSRPIFAFGEAQEILRSRQTTQKVLGKLVKRGIVTRLTSGLFQLVPFELGFQREHLGNPYVVARELVKHHRGKAAQISEPEYYLSHASAMDLHQMVTQPQLVVYSTTPRQIRPRTILGTEFRFVRCKEGHLFGTTDMWVEKSEKVKVSDIERTIIDGLKQPEYCGGFSEVVKGFWIKKGEVAPLRLVDYALRLDVGAVISRLGFLMEVFEIDAPSEIERLHNNLTATYHMLDPELPSEGKFLARWRLRLNVTEEELLALGRS